MAGFFGLFDPTKPGKGVSPDEHSGRFKTFWEVLWRKLGKIILLNIFYFLIVSPILFFLYLNLYSSVMEITNADINDLSTFVFQMMLSVAQMFPDWLNYILLAASVVFYGPATCGLIYVLRNYAREEHAWVSDFFTRMMRNFGQGLFFGLLDVVVGIIMINNIGLLLNNPALTAIVGNNLQMFKTLSFISLGIFVIFLFARHYFYLLAVTFESKIPQIIKNSFIFSALGLGRNVLSTVLMLAVIILSIFINPLIELIMVPLLMLSLCGYIEVYLAYPAVKKYMIDPLKEQEEAEKEEEYKGFYPPVPEGDKLSDPIEIDRTNKPWLPPEDWEEREHR